MIVPSDGAGKKGREQPRVSGKVKWYNPSKGFGFITPADPSVSSQEIFVHQSEIELPGFRSLAEGAEVEFELCNTEKGPKALKVTGPGGTKAEGAKKIKKVAVGKPVTVKPVANTSLFPSVQSVNTNSLTANSGVIDDELFLKNTVLAQQPLASTSASAPVNTQPQLSQTVHISPQLLPQIAAIQSTPNLVPLSLSNGLSNSSNAISANDLYLQYLNPGIVGQFQANQFHSNQFQASQLQATSPGLPVQPQLFNSYIAAATQQPVTTIKPPILNSSLVNNFWLAQQELLFNNQTVAATAAPSIANTIRPPVTAATLPSLFPPETQIKQIQMQAPMSTNNNPELIPPAQRIPQQASRSRSYDNLKTQNFTTTTFPERERSLSPRYV